MFTDVYKTWLVVVFISATGVAQSQALSTKSQQLNCNELVKAAHSGEGTYQTYKCRTGESDRKGRSIASTFTPAGIRALERGESPAAILFPYEAWEVLIRNPFLLWDYSADNPASKREVTTPAQLAALIATLEQANSIIRKSFLKNPPEQSELYKQNKGPPTPSSKQRESQPYLEIAHEERLGFPAGTHFFYVLTTPELFELTLVKTDKGVKVAWARVYPFN